MLKIIVMMMMTIVRSWVVGVGSNHTSRLLSRTPSFRFGRAFDEPDDDDNNNDEGYDQNNQKDSLLPLSQSIN